MGGPLAGAARSPPRHRLGAATGISHKWPQGMLKGICKHSPLTAAIDPDTRA